MAEILLYIFLKDAIMPGKFSKMMEKMGWKPGEGLGANRQGMAAPIQIKRNVETRGLGFGRKTGTEQMHHAGAFEKFQNVLDLLNSDSDVKSKKKKLKKESDSSSSSDSDSNKKSRIHSLEATSKKVKGRVHYQKFTRGKDVSRYSADEMACVLGSKAFNLLNDLQPEDDKKDTKFVNSVQNSEEYFRSAKSANNSPKLNSDGNSSAEDVSSDEGQMARPSFGGGASKNFDDATKKTEVNTFSFYTNFQSSGFINDKKTEDSEDSKESDDENTNTILANNLKDRYKNNYMNSFVKSNEVDDAHNNIDEIANSEESCSKSLEKGDKQKKKKSKKNPKTISDVSVVEPTKDSIKKKKINSKDEPQSLDNEVIDAVSNSCIKKKKKKSKSSTDNENLSLTNDQIDTNLKKISKKQKSKSYTDDITSTDDLIDLSLTKKSKKKSKTYLNITEAEISSKKRKASARHSSDEAEDKPKKKRKKNSNEKEKDECPLVGENLSKKKKKKAKK